MHTPVSVNRPGCTLNQLPCTYCTHTLYIYLFAFVQPAHLVSEHFRVAVNEVAVTLCAHFILWREY